MIPARIPDDEERRLASLHALYVLDSDPEAEFESLVRVASAVCGSPVSLLSLVAEDRQWFKANVGLPGATESPRDVAFCAHAILGDGVFEIPDALQDPRFFDNPFVVEHPEIRFYAGAPVQLSDGSCVGTLCVIDQKPRTLSAAQRDILMHLANVAAQALEGRRAIMRAKQLGHDLAEQHELMRVTLRSIGDAVITADAEGKVEWLNPVAEHLTGWTSREARGHPLEAVFSIVDGLTRLPLPVSVLPAAAGEVGSRHLEADSTFDAPQALLLSKQGTEFAIEHSASPIHNDDATSLGVVVVFRDVTEQRRLAGELKFQATHDALTGLANRSKMESCLRRAWSGAQQNHGQHALLCIDLDSFKLVNDACGHAAGDRLLQQVAGMLRSAVRSSDTVARLGGDEFAVLLDQCTVAKAEELAQRLCNRMDEYRFTHGDKKFRIGMSIGLVSVDGHWSGISAILQAGDSACYGAKAGGRNRVHVWLESDSAMQTRSGHSQWAARIEQALEEDRFVLYAQRIEPLGVEDEPDAGEAGERSAPAGRRAEVLIRMLDTDGSIISPALFLPAAERFHLAPRVDRWVLQTTLGWMGATEKARGIASLSVNLSGQSIGDREFHRWAVEMLAGADPQTCRRLCLEITETSAVTNLAEAAAFVSQVRSLGVRIALDDFGAGASSFGYLKNLTVDYLKIDGQFIQSVLEHPLDAAAVRGFVDVARVLGIQTVAEFVDRPAVLEWVRAIGVDFAQGYFLHRPVPLDDLLT